MTQCRASITLLFEMMADWLCRTVDNHVLPMTFLQTFTGHEVGQDKEKCLDFKFAHWDDSAEIMIRFSFGTSQHRDRSPRIEVDHTTHWTCMAKAKERTRQYKRTIQRNERANYGYGIDSFKNYMVISKYGAIVNQLNIRQRNLEINSY